MITKSNCCAFCPDSLTLLREKCSPNCGRGAPMAPVTLYQIKRTMKPPIMCFGSCFLAIRWSTVSVSSLVLFPQ